MNKLLLIASALFALPLTACEDRGEPSPIYSDEVPGPGPHEPQMPE